MPLRIFVLFYAVGMAKLLLSFLCFKTEIASNVKELRNSGFMILIGYNAITYALSFQVLKLVIEKLSMIR